MVATISPDPRLQFFASDGSFLVGGKLYTYAAGTTTPLATYTTSTGLIANTNPVILDSRGEASVWLSSSKYKFVLKTAADVDIWTQDQLQGYANADGSNATGTWPISITGNAGTATTATYATTAGSVTPGNAVTSITGAGLYGFTLPGGPITSSGTLTVTPPVPSTAGNVLTSNGSAWVSQAFSAGGNLRVQLFTSSGTWTAPAGTTTAIVYVVGSGGGGAGANIYNSGGSGGAGGAGYGIYTVTSGASYTITIGAAGAAGAGASMGNPGGNATAGGTCSFGSLISATGGGGGTGALPSGTGDGTDGATGIGVNTNLSISLSPVYNPYTIGGSGGIGGGYSGGYSGNAGNPGTTGFVYVQWVG